MVAKYEAAQQPAQAHQQQQPQGPTSRVHTGAIRVTAGYGVEHLNQARTTGEDASASFPLTPGSILHTARSPVGRTGRINDSVTVELIPGDPSTRTSIKPGARLPAHSVGSRNLAGNCRCCGVSCMTKVGSAYGICLIP